jgi:hypothetical protein
METWTEFTAAVEGLTPEQMRREGVLPGWSMKELLGHMEFWLTRAAEGLEVMREGTFSGREATDEEVDRQNATAAAVARSRDLSDIRTALAAARVRVRSALYALPELQDIAIEAFAGETYDHYAEHLSDVRRLSMPRERPNSSTS